MTNLRDVLKMVNGNTFIGLDTITIPTLKGGRKNPQQGRVTKVVEGSNVMVFTNSNMNGYNNMVKRRLQQEGKDPETFELQSRKWGTRLPKLPIVEHKGEYYLEVIFLNAGKSLYFLDGQPIKKDEVDGLQESQAPEQGGLDNKVMIRTYKVASIKRMTINHQVLTNLTFS